MRVEEWLFRAINYINEITERIEFFKRPERKIFFSDYFNLDEKTRNPFRITGLRIFFEKEFVLEEIAWSFTSVKENSLYINVVLNQHFFLNLFCYFIAD